MKAVIRGTRLQPYTLVLPKPLMPVGDLPVIELLLKWLRRNGITQIFITTGDLLTDLNLWTLLQYHRQHDDSLTDWLQRLQENTIPEAGPVSATSNQ